MWNTINPDLNDMLWEPSYTIVAPRPNLRDTRGKITTAFFPSTVRVGFAIDHQTLSLNMDFSAELNVMNILEIIGNSELFAEHYQAFKQYFEVLEDLTQYVKLKNEYTLEIVDLADTRNVLIQDSDNKEVQIGIQEQNYIDYNPTMTILNQDDINSISSAMILYSKTHSDELLIENISAIAGSNARKALQSIIDANNALDTLLLLILGDGGGDPGLDDTTQPEFTPIRLAAQQLADNRVTYISDSVQNPNDVGNAFRTLMEQDGNIDIAFAGRSLSSITSISNQLETYLSGFNIYLEYLTAAPGMDTMVSDLTEIQEALLYINRERKGESASAGITIAPYLSDANYYTLQLALNAIMPLYYSFWRYTDNTFRNINDLAKPFLISASVNALADADRLSSDQSQNTINTYLNERLDKFNGLQTREELITESQAELAWISAQMSKTYFEINAKDDIINNIDNNIVPGLLANKSALEQASDGVIAKMESEKPIKSIFYLSNFERVQYNYTYLTIRIRTKYSVYDEVTNNIGIITNRLNDLADQPLVDPSLVVELSKLKTSYATVQQQILAELDSMLAEYNRIRTEHYGILTPIAPGDRDFSDGITDTDGDGINDIVSGFSYANPDLECMAISE